MCCASESCIGIDNQTEYNTPIGCIGHPGQVLSHLGWSFLLNLMSLSLNVIRLHNEFHTARFCVCLCTLPQKMLGHVVLPVSSCNWAMMFQLCDAAIQSYLVLLSNLWTVAFNIEFANRCYVRHDVRYLQQAKERTPQHPQIFILIPALHFLRTKPRFQIWRKSVKIFRTLSPVWSHQGLWSQQGPLRPSKLFYFCRQCCFDRNELSEASKSLKDKKSHSWTGITAHRARKTRPNDSR